MPKSDKWFALATGYLLFVSSAVMFFEVPPLVVEMGKEIPLGDVAIGWLQGMYAIPAVLLAFIGGRIIDRFESRASGITAGALLLAGNVLFMLGDTLAVLLFARFIVGVGTILANLVSARMLTVWFPPNRRGLSMSVFNTAWPISAGVAYSTFVAAGVAVGWRSVILGVNIFTLLTWLLFIWRAPADPPETVSRTGTRILSQLQQLPRPLWLTAVAWFCFIAGVNSILTFGGSFLADRGLGFARGTFYIGLFMWMAIPGSLIGGWIIDRWGNLRTHMFLSVAVGTTAFIVVLAGFESALMMIIMGAFASLVPIVVYAMPGLLVHPSRLGIAFGVILTFSNVGNTIGPVAIGWIASLSEGYTLGMIAATILISCSAVFFIPLRTYRLALKPGAGGETRNNEPGIAREESGG